MSLVGATQRKCAGGWDVPVTQAAMKPASDLLGANGMGPNHRGRRGLYRYCENSRPNVDAAVSAHERTAGAEERIGASQRYLCAVRDDRSEERMTAARAGTN